ncbi:MAG TPA: hypothetical protein VJN18_03340 [Polyangiaceae bacterium]|nr:hypothetical protein [Polyangiaceae bacterium]
MPEAVTGHVHQSICEPAPIADGGCDPSLMSCAPPPATQVVTLEPIVVEGDAGTSALVSAYDRGRHEAPSCIDKRNSALLACGGVAISGVGLALSGSTGVGLLVSSAGLLVSLERCLQNVDGYQRCLEDGAARADEANRCEEHGGTPAGGVDPRQVVCLTNEP